MPKVSVIIPVFNGEKYIKEAIESVLAQTFKDIEIVIVNDASTDRTEEVIFNNFKNLIQEGKIIYLKNPTNKERVFSRNLGAKKAKGEYLFFLDYDDKWKNNYIEQVVKNFNNTDVVYSFPRSFIDNTSKIIRTSRKNLPSLERIIFSGSIGYPSASAFKKNSFLKYKEEFLMREDWEIFLRYFLKGKNIKILDNNTVLIREHQSRTSKNKSFFYATLKVYDFYEDKTPSKFLPYMQIHISDVAFKYGDFKTGYKFLFKAVKQNPKVILEKKNFINFLKRSIRIDRFLLNR